MSNVIASRTSQSFGVDSMPVNQVPRAEEVQYAENQTQVMYYNQWYEKLQPYYTLSVSLIFHGSLIQPQMAGGYFVGSMAGIE